MNKKIRGFILWAKEIGCKAIELDVQGKNIRVSVSFNDPVLDGNTIPLPIDIEQPKLTPEQQEEKEMFWSVG